MFKNLVNKVKSQFEIDPSQHISVDAMRDLKSKISNYDMEASIARFKERAAFKQTKEGQDQLAAERLVDEFEELNEEARQIFINMVNEKITTEAAA